MAAATAKIITSVIVTWTTSPKVRMAANKDLPEYGLKAGDVFYLVRSSKADKTNEYYIARWADTEWQCPCPSRKPCRHKKIVSADCQTRRPVVQKAVQLVSEEEQAVQEVERQLDDLLVTPAKQPDPMKSPLNGNRPFSLGIEKPAGYQPLDDLVEAWADDVVVEKVAACEVAPVQNEVVVVEPAAEDAQELLAEVPQQEEDNYFSPYQRAIFKAIVEDGVKNLVVAAVPGSGKTTTLIELIARLPQGSNVLSVAFNKDAADQLSRKITARLAELGNDAPLAESRTIHSLGNATLTAAGLKCSTKSNKYFVLCRAFLEERFTDSINTARQVAKLIDMVRLTLSGTDEASLIRLVNRFEIDLEPSDESLWSVVKEAVPHVLQLGINQCKNEKIIDFTDMIYLPHVLNLRPRQYDYVLVDEAQDLSPCQREFVLKARKTGGAFISVGDRNQAIYGFAGASLRSIDEIVEATGAVVLPLSICYRCPKAVVELAANIYSGIEASKHAEEGTVERILEGQVSSLIQPGDLILCRLTAPLVEQCLAFLRQGIRANVRGRDLGATFTSLIEKVKKTNRSLALENLEECVREYARKQIELLSKRIDENEMKISALQDRVDTLIALLDAYQEKMERYEDLKGFIFFIEQFFKEDKDAQIILSTVHRAKGLEYKRVFILQSEKMPHPKAKSQEQLVQEYNLMYVAYTRAQESLYLVVERLATTPALDEEL